MLHPKLIVKWQWLLNKTTKNKVFARTIPVIMGLVALAWFLIRVIPKPQRASYPCMQAAYPIMSGTVIWLLGISGIFASSKMLISSVKQKKVALAFATFGALLVFALVHTLNQSQSLLAQHKAEPVHPANEPFGTGTGILPGRVAWAWNPDATNQNCTNDLTQNDGYFLPKNNNQTVIDELVAQSVYRIANQTVGNEAWDAVFKQFNNRKGKGNVGYQTDEVVFLKVNQGCANWSTNADFTRQNWALGYAETSPQIILSILKELVNVAGVPQNKIIVADPLSHLYDDTYTVLHDVFPDVVYGDRATSEYGRTLLHKETDPVLFYSDKGTILDASTDCLYTEYQNADYIINIAALKAHACAGITLTAKNHFGSHTRDASWHLHPGLVGEENDLPTRLNYGMYRIQVDLMASKYLGQNTLLYVVDGLWGGTEATETPVKWEMTPFNNDWPSSVFISLDQVALESVCFDFLRNEAKVGDAAWKNRPNFAQGVDDYLHQAASRENWPEGIVYDPDNSGTPIGSLGVHEHWDSPETKNYTRNLGTEKGIELIKILPKQKVGTNFVAHDAEAGIPVIDGDPTDEAWDLVEWQQIDQFWIPYGTALESTDFSGRFKIVWSSVQNKCYVLAETTDDNYIDGYTYPNGNYYDYDVLEIFIDEDKSGGMHVFDNNATMGKNAENAFSYHINVNFPAEGQTTSLKTVCDIAGSDWGNRTTPNYADHFPEFVVKRSGQKMVWEFTLSVYNDTYDPKKSASENTSALSALSNGKTLGIAFAYCDADDAVGRDNFIGSDYGVADGNNEFNQYWQNADGYGTLTLKSQSATSVVDKQKHQSLFEQAFVVYPNPANEWVNIDAADLLPGTKTTLSVYNLQGQCLKTCEFITQSTQVTQQVSISDLPSGQYFMNISNHNRITTKPFFVTK